MLTKTVRAETMLIALEAIKKELGPDAQVVSVRQVLGGPAWMVWKKHFFEVVAVKPEQKNNFESLPAEAGYAQANEMTQPVKVESKKNIQNLLQRTYQLGAVNQSDEGEDRQPQTNPSIPDHALPTSKSDPRSDFGQVLRSFESNSSLKKTSQSPVEIRHEPEMHEFSDQIAQAIKNFPPVVGDYYHHLLHQGLDATLIFRSCKTCADSIPEKTMQDKEKVGEYLRKQLIAGIKPVKESAFSIPPVIFIVGTSGVGKTSVCAKLAVRFISEFKLKIGWVCADTVRVAALAEARTYADAIGIPMNVSYSPDELLEAVKNFEIKPDSILIDTPAFNPRDEASLVQLGNLLTLFPQRATWLVIPATAKDDDLQNILAALGPFKPRGMVLTKLDETNHFGASYNVAWRNQTQYMYYSSGNRVVNDLHPAKPDVLVRALFDERFIA